MDEVVQPLLSALDRLGPATVGELFECASLKVTPARARQLAKVAPVFIADLSKTVVATKAFVGRPGKVEEALESDGLLLSLLELPHVKGNKARAHTKSQLRDMVAKPFRTQWAKVLNERFASGRWPIGVGMICSRSSELVMLLDDVVGAQSSPPRDERPATVPDPPRRDLVDVREFEALFEDAFRSIRRRERTPLVELVALRKMLPQYPKSDFDQCLRAMRQRSQRYVLETFDGRHGRLGSEAREAGISEGGNLYVYVARREQ